MLSMGCPASRKPFLLPSSTCLLPSSLQIWTPKGKIVNTQYIFTLAPVPKHLLRNHSTQTGQKLCRRKQLRVPLHLVTVGKLEKSDCHRRSRQGTGGTSDLLGGTALCGWQQKQAVNKSQNTNPVLGTSLRTHKTEPHAPETHVQKQTWRHRNTGQDRTSAVPSWPVDGL